MSYIAPNSTIKLFSNIPLEPGYTNTLWFDTLADQNTYFHETADVITTLTDQYYSRPGVGYLRVQVPIGSCYTCNYLAFKNTSFENKWFYAFVTSVTYINNEVTELSYTIDKMQTYQHDVVWNTCFVEREHCYKTADVPGNYLLPEPVEVGGYLYSGYDNLSNLDSCIIVAVADTTSASVDGRIISGSYQGCTLYAFNATTSGAGALNAFLANYLVKPEAIIGIYMAPKSAVAVGQSLITDGQTVTSVVSSQYFNGSRSTATFKGKTANGYAPLNNKLYTYPYNAYQVNSSKGDSVLLRYEYFGLYGNTSLGQNVSQQPKFRVKYTASNPAQITLRPVDYKGMMYNENLAILEDKNISLTLADFPMCSWCFDAYSLYMARNWQDLILETGKSAATVGLGALGFSSPLENVAASLNGKTLTAGMGSLVYNEGSDSAASIWMNPYTGRRYQTPSISSEIPSNLDQLNNVRDLMGATNQQGISSLLKGAYWATKGADDYHGSLMSGNADFVTGEYGFYGQRCSIPEENAEAIDKYFSMFGYSTNQVKIPNYHSRPVFNYIKTVGETFKPISFGKVSSSDLAIMNAVANKGITFWHDHSNAVVGNYSDTILNRNNVAV